MTTIKKMIILPPSISVNTTRIHTLSLPPQMPLAETSSSPCIDNDVATSTSTTAGTTSQFSVISPLQSPAISKFPFSNETPSGNQNRGTGSSTSSSVQVAVRVRPPLPSEAGHPRCVTVYSTSSSTHTDAIRIGASDENSGVTFTFDQTFSSSASQRQVFNVCVKPLVKACLQGYNATVLAYGQTGSGKTFTILGPSSATSVESEEANESEDGEEADESHSLASISGGSMGTAGGSSQAGVIPRALRELFNNLEETMASHYRKKDSTSNCADSPGAEQKTPPYEYEVRVQFLELYGEEIRDLLLSTQESQQQTGANKLTIRDGGAAGVEPEVIGASEVRVSSAEEALLCLTRGTLRRVTGATAMNAESSRSHAIMTVVVEHSTVICGSDESEGRYLAANENAEIEVIRSKFHFVDLAGSERAKRSMAEGKRLKEGIDINKGLLVLGNVISALGDPKKRGKTFVPYRDSKLTRLLKGSLGGNHKTLMIACVSPSSSNMEESLNCLRYANRAKNIENNAIVNVDAGSRLVAELRSQIISLATELLQYRENAKEESNADAHHTLENDKTLFSIDTLRLIVGGGDSTILKLQSSKDSKSRFAAREESSNEPEEKSAEASNFTFPLATRRQEKSDNRLFTHEALASTFSAEFSVLGDCTQFSPDSSVLKLHPQLISTEDNNIMPHVEDQPDSTHNEIKCLRAKLNEMRENLYVTTEDLFAAKAEKEYYRLQVPENNNEAELAKNGKVLNEKDPVVLATFAQYEREVSRLRIELRDAKAIALRSIEVSSAISPALGWNNDFDFQPHNNAVLSRVKDVLKEEKATLCSLRQTRVAHNQLERLTKSESIINAAKLATLPEGKGHAEVLDAEIGAEEKEIDIMTSKYIQFSNSTLHDEDRDDENENIDAVDTELETTFKNDNQDAGDDYDEAFFHRQQQLDAHMYDLSKSIAAKEELIDQLNSSQEKYETMRLFYEEKLREMESQLKLREEERSNLVVELRKHEEDTENFKELQNALTAKEKHIASLRKRQLELSNLTKVSSRNELVITRLREDISALKKQKIDFSKRMMEERKAHAVQLKTMQKEALQRDRAADKSKQELNIKKVEVEKAKRVAKTHLEEVNKLRSKYRAAEKQLRKQTLKRGVMERAGIDSVMIGRREPRLHSSVKAKEMKTYAPNKKNEMNLLVEVDVEKVRSFLDEKVSNICRKEAAADKLAQEWEDHLDLTTRKHELLKLPIDKRKENYADELEALDVQIEYKEGRVRQLTRRLGKSKGSRVTKAENVILEEEGFKDLCSGLSGHAAAHLATKVLFGMVVRERRRVAALARTASALDQKAIDAEALAQSKEAALRSHMEEQRHERASMANTQQEHILSLMALVQENNNGVDPATDEKKTVEGSGCDGNNTPKGDVVSVSHGASSESIVLRLANERIDVLEMQLHELQGEKEAKRIYKAKEEEKSAALARKTEECDELQKGLKHLRSSLRQIRETTNVGLPPLHHLKKSTRSSNDNDMSTSLQSDESPNRLHVEFSRKIFNIIQDALHPPQGSPRKKTGAATRLSAEKRIRIEASPVKTPNIKKHIAMMHSSDSEDDEAPEWAGDIMSDLAIIATGAIPPSLKKTTQKWPSTQKKSSVIGKQSVIVQADGHRNPKVGEGNTSKSANVFDRLTNPEQFTGIQKNTFNTRTSTASADNSLGSGIDSRPSTANSRQSKAGHRSGYTNTAAKVGQGVEVGLQPPFSLPLEVAFSGPTNVKQDARPTILLTPPERGNEDVDGKRSDHRSVFERLQSPSNYTGTQKSAHPGTTKRSPTDESYIEADHAPHFESPYGKVAKDVSANVCKTPYSTSEWVAEYTQQDVFERLQKKVTQSYAVKHQPIADERGL